MVTVRPQAVIQKMIIGIGISYYAEASEQEESSRRLYLFFPLSWPSLCSG